MAAPELSAAYPANRGVKTARGPVEAIGIGAGPRIPHAREKIKFSRCPFAQEHEAFHSRSKRKGFDKPAWFRGLLRGVEFSGREFSVVLVLQFLLASARFFGWPR